MSGLGGALGSVGSAFGSLSSSGALGPLADLTGSIMQSNSIDSANKAQMGMAAQQMAMQREFAQHGIRWKVADAEAAGLSPLAALGAQTTSYSPVSVGQDSSSPMGEFASRMGQNMTRAAAAAMTDEERKLLTMKMQAAELDLEGKALDNQYRLSQIQQMNRTGPAMPSTSGLSPALLGGQGNSSPTAMVMEKALERTHSSPSNAAQEVGHVSDYGFARTNTGLAIVPSKDVKEKIEDQMVPELMWAARNIIAPNIGNMPAPSTKDFPLPPGYKWKWDHLTQEFRPSKGKGRAHMFPAMWD